MCGITGFVSFEGHVRSDAAARARRMADAIIYRGPNEEGYYSDDFAALGHRRLSFIDLSSGQQPMSALDGRVQIIFNGEVYNFLEVRAELEALGHRFHTRSDTEVILLSYVQWGERCAERLSGMFAFAIWDARDRRLFLARDRVGKKPLYYYRKGPVFAFASELKALQAGGFCPTDIDPEALDCYLTFGYIPAPRTIYAGVRKLAAARTLMVSAAGESERRYWQLSFAQPRERPLEEAADELQVLLDDAVKCRLVSEVPLGAFLSGGLDSSLVVESMSRCLGRPVITNSIGFEDKEFNELSTAGLVARELKTEHHEHIVKPNALESVPKIAEHFDEPMADSSAVPMWYLCQMARSTMTAALSGDGGDESFGGYTFRYVPHMMEASLRASLPTALRRPVFGALGALWPASARLPQPLRLKTIFENLAVGDAEAFYRDLAWLRPDNREAIYTPDFMASLRGFTPMETIAPFYMHNDAPDALARSQFADIHFYMTDDVLVKVDRMSMAHSLEVRSPLLDHRILEFAARLPARLKIQARRGKLLLRELAKRRLPAQLQSAPKKGFSIPAASWLRNELRPLAESLLFESRRSYAPLLEQKEIRRLWNEHLSGARDHNVFIWALMMLGLWDAQRAR